MIKTRSAKNAAQIRATTFGGTLQDSACLAAVICFAISAVSLAIMQNGECSQPPREFGIHAYLIDWMGSANHYVWQGRGYFVLIGLCAVFVLAAPILRKFLVAQNELRAKILKVLVCSLALVAFGIKSIQNPTGMAFGLVCVPFLILLLKQTQRLPKYIYMILLFAFVALLIVPGLFVIPDLTSLTSGKLLEIQTHYSDVVGPGAMLAAGKRLFHEVDPFYGVIQPICIAALGAKMSSFSFGSYVELVRVFQAVFIVMAACLFYRLAGRAKVASLFAIAFFAPFMQLNQMSEYFPNQTAWRLLGFPIAIVGMLISRSLSPLAMSYTLGALASALLLLNFETGMCVLAGFLAFLYLRVPQKGVERILPLLKNYGVFGLGMITSFVALYLLGWVILGYAPDLNAFAALFPAKQLMVKSGYLGGGRLTFQPIPFLVVAHCLYTIVRISLDSEFPASFRNSVRVTTATMCLLWFTYYVNRPAPGDQYLIGCYFLYSFLIIDLVRSAIIGLKRKSLAIEPALVTCAVLSLIIVPRIFQQLNTASSNLKATARELLQGPTQQPASIVSGVYLPSALGAEVTRKSTALKSMSKDGPVFYLSASSFIIPCLSGYSAAPVNDLYSNLAFESDTDRLVSRLNSANVSTVVVDAPNTVLTGYKSWSDCFDDLRQKLSRYYRHTSTKDGWEIWTKRTGNERRSG